MNGISNIIKKELTRVFKDKKLVFSLFILPVIIMVGVYSLIGKLQTAMMDDVDKHVANVYMQNAPEGFEDFLASVKYTANITYLDGAQDINKVKTDIKSGSADLLVVFDEGFLTSVQGYKEGDGIPQVRTFYNPSEQYSATARSMFIETALTPYQQVLLSQRIGNLDTITVFRIDANAEESIVVDEKKATGKSLGMILPYFITMMLFAGAMSLGVDAITGEKERGTMASMLITPIKRSEIVIGKILSLTVLSCLSAAVYAVAMIITMPKMIESMNGDAASKIAISFSPVQIAELLAIMLSLVLLYVSLVALVAVYAKTAKEANTYISPMYMLVVVAGMITMFQNGKIKPIYHAIPIYGSAASIQKLLMGELPLGELGMTLASTLFLAGVLVALISQAFNSEKVMFNA